MILIVDDQQSMCWILSKVLSETGFSVETVETAEKALSIVDDKKISVVVIDYRLPDMNGFELFSELKKRDSNTQAILITSYGSKRLKEEALNLGFYSYFDKPFDNHTLIRSIISALEDLKQPRKKKASEREYDISRECERSFRIFFETVPIAAVLADVKGKTVRTNRAAQEVFGYTEKEFRGKALTDLLRLNDSDEYSELLEELQSKRDYFQMESRFYRKESNSDWAEVTFSTVRGAKRELRYIVGMFRDITERKEAEEQQLLQSEKSSGMGLLAASVAHELGNPLSIMSSTLQYVRDSLSDVDDQQLTEAIDTVMDSIGEMHKLLLSLSELTGSQKPNFELIDIGSILSQMLIFINREAEAHKIEVSSQFDKNLPDCQVDQNEIRQLFLNLVKNAIEAMPNGGKLKVKTHLIDSEDSVCIEISDTGTGIDKDELRSIFKPFHSTKPGGMGLGLTSCRSVVQKHGGEITVESDLDEGSTFRVVLPISQENTDY